MTKVLDVIPSWVYALAVALCLAALSITWVRLAGEKAEFADFRREVEENTRIAVEKARAEEQEKQRNAEQIAIKSAQRQQALETRLARVNAAAAGLREQIAALNDRPTPTDAEAAAYAREARTARELLGACGEEHRDMAKSADELRDQVVGLQETLYEVCKVPK